MRSRIVFIFLLVLGLAAAARAQSVRWETSDDPAVLVLTFASCSPDGDPQIPAVPGVTFTFAGSGTRTEMINFRTTNYVQLTYRLRASSSAPISIPAFTVKTDQGNVQVPAFNAGPVRSSALDGAAVSRLTPANATLWAGEVFPITYTLDVTRRNFNQLGSNPDWTAAPVVAEDWTKPEGAEVTSVNGEARVNVVYKARGFAKAPGAIALNSVTQLVNLQTGSIGGFFSLPRVEQIAVESNRPQLTVRALPAPPAGFSGGVGQFNLVSKIVPEKAAVGEPVTWTLELTGTGNWPDLAGLPARDVSNDFQVVQPRAKRTPAAEGKLFDVTLSEDVVLVPTKAGNYALGPVNFVYFDPKSGAYKTLSTPRTTVTITAPNTPKPVASAPGTDATPTTPPADTVEKSVTPPVTPPPPAGIPRDPLPGSANARTPFDHRSLLIYLLAPVLGLLLFWSWLALRRAQRTDPVRPRRDARARLAATLAQMRTGAHSGSQPSALSSQLLRWQHDTAVLWQISHAAPPATALADTAWSTLWAECERSLYGPKTSLPADWVARAEAALAAKRVPGFQPLRLFLPRNLLPFAATIFLFLVPCSLLLAASETGSVAYRRGDFAAAEKTWRETIAKTPTDWIARHNLSLALAQQDRAGEAAAQAAAAFVQNPSDPSVRWHFTLASEKAGFVPGPLSAFLNPGPLQSLARLASPAEWQLILIVTAVVAALAIGWILLNLYGARSRFVSAAASIILGLCIAGSAAAVAGFLSYGTTADEHAVVAWHTATLRSIPTDADVTQKTSPLSAGSVAIVDKTFLPGDRWLHLVFENGQTGWVRKEDLVPLWH